MSVKRSSLWQPGTDSLSDSLGLKCVYCIFVVFAQGWSDLFSPPLTCGTAASSETVCVTLVDRVFLRPSIQCLCGGFSITVLYISCLIFDWRDSLGTVLAPYLVLVNHLHIQQHMQKTWYKIVHPLV